MRESTQMSRVRYLRSGKASLVMEVNTSSPLLPSGRTSPVSGSMISAIKWSSFMCMPVCSEHSKLTPGPLISVRPYIS